MDYSRRKRRLRSKIIPIGILVLLVLLVGAGFAIWRTYEQNLEPVSSSEQSQSFTVATGASAKEIAASLQEVKLIRAAWAFEWYVRKEGARELLKAGTYDLRPNMSVSQIVALMTQGKIATDLVTIPPGRNLDQIKQALIDQYGFSSVIVQEALNPEKYLDHPVFADKPPGASLEGFLYPESFHKTAQTTPEDIIRGSLDQMYRALTSEIKNGFAQQGLTVYQGITLASLVEKEVSGQEDRRMVAQVLLRRLRENIPLRSDPAPYTYEHQGLPPSPISNVSASSLEAVANPASTDFLYFVSGDDGRTHFSHTFEQHEALIRQYCTQLCP